MTATETQTAKKKRKASGSQGQGLVTPPSEKGDGATSAAKATQRKKSATQPTTKAKKPSALDAAAKLLAESGAAMTTGEMIEAMAAKGYWTSPGGKTPQATLSSAILRELTTKGKDARFKKTERGKFALNKE